MRGRALFLPVFTAAAVLLAVSLPMGTLQQWDRNYQDVLHQESVDETRWLRIIPSVARIVCICCDIPAFLPGMGKSIMRILLEVSRWRCGRWNPLHPWKLAGKTMSAKIPFPTVIF